MGIPETILRLTLVTFLSVALSVLAMLSVRLTGIDLKDIKQRTHPKVLVIAMLFNLLFILSVALILRIWDHKSIGILGFSFSSMEVIFAIFAMLFSLALAMMYVFILHRVGKIIAYRTPDHHRNSEKWATSVLGVLVLFVAALQEEILFRGYFSFILLPHGFWYAIIISSVVFTLWHFLTNHAGFFQTTDWLMGGIVLFYIYWISGSIWVAAFVHFSRNLTNVLVFDISGQNSLVHYKHPLKPSFKSLYTILFSLLLMLSGAIVFQ
jgi:membrane protease YdiL (CAAX protease family)